jgi:hypothetical protein
MRWFEIKEMSRIKQNRTLINKNGIVTQDEDEAHKVYASNFDLQTIVDKIKPVIQNEYPESKVVYETKTKPPHIRVYRAPYSEVADEINKLHPMQDGDDPADKAILRFVSGDPNFVRKLIILDTEDGPVSAPIVFTQDREKEGNTGGATLIDNKQLTPDRFGFGGREFSNADAVASETIKKLETLIKDEKLRNALIQLVEVANGSRNAVEEDLINYITANKKTYNNISKDFGEILTPIKIGKEEGQAISFPSGSNEAMIDVTVGSQPVAVKSLSGSGNGMDSIGDMIDAYQETIDGEKDERRKKLYQLVNSQRTKKSGERFTGKVNDNLIFGAFLVPTKEAEQLEQLLGAKPKNYANLVKIIENYYNKNLASIEDPEERYKEWLEALKPISIASNYGKELKNGKFKIQPIGLPSDFVNYLNFDETNGAARDKKKEARTGYNLYKRDFIGEASKNVAYLLGVSMNSLYGKGGKESEDMEKLMSDIMRNKDAYAAHITINKDGTIDINKQSFKDLHFGFQYHAATNAPNRNAPGYHIIFK